MTIKVEVTGASPAEVGEQIAGLAALFGGVSAAALSAGETAAAGEQRRSRRTKAEMEAARAAEAGAAPDTSVAPKTSTQSSADELARTVAGVATVVAPEPDAADAIDDDGLDDGPAITRDDVKALLLEVKQKNASVPNVVASLIQSVAGAGVTKFADVKDELLPQLHAAAQAKLG
jgi:hypothetical protein